MKKKQFENALCHLLQADHHFRCVTCIAASSRPDVLDLMGPVFPSSTSWLVLTCVWCLVSSKCGSTLLSSVDNFAVLQLDIVWCYRALKALTCLDDARKRLQKAEDCFLQCYGQQQQRLLMIKVQTCINQQKLHMPLDFTSITLLICVVRVTQAERTCCFCGCTSFRVSCPTLKEMTFWLNNTWIKFVLFLSIVLVSTTR